MKLQSFVIVIAKALGPPQTVNARKQLAGRRGYIEYGWNFTTTWVGFVNAKGVLHAVLVGTDAVAEKTRSGVGTGSLVGRLIGEPGVRCYLGAEWESHPYFDPLPRFRPYCVLGNAKGVGTVFALKCLHGTPSGCRGYKVAEVIVRTSF